MSHHIGDTNEMSDTPRTDAARQDEHDPYMAVASECTKLEKELAAASNRIKRLEEAGDAMADLLEEEMFMKLAVQWRKAKEDKL